jgi:hypothetical protein
MSRLNRLGRKSIPETSWLAHIAARKPRMLVAIALANKMARTIWALMTKNEDYRVPAQAAVVAPTCNQPNLTSDKWGSWRRPEWVK